MRPLLEAAHYDVTYSDEGAALDVFARLFRQPYRVLVVAATGLRAPWPPMAGRAPGWCCRTACCSPRPRSARVVPELVFLNCCHLGAMSATPETANRLACSLSRERSSRWVCAALWRQAGGSMNDAARCFAEPFGEFVSNNAPFGSAVRARLARQSGSVGRSATPGAPTRSGDPITGSSLAPAAAAARGGAGFASQTDCRTGAAAHDAHHDANGICRRRARRSRRCWRGCRRAGANARRSGCARALYGESSGEEPRMPARPMGDLVADDPGGKVPVKAIEQLANLGASWR